MRALLFVFALAAASAGCALTGHASHTSTLGVPRSTAELLAVIDTPGPVVLETIASADWAVPRSGLINLDNPRARAAGLKDGDEPIQIYFHALRHPERGLYLVDTGVEKALRDHPEKAAIRGLVASKMHFEKLRFLAPLGEWLASHPEPVRGVFITHLHVDHVTGLADVPAGTTVSTGPGEGGARAFVNMFVKPNIDRSLEGKAALAEWPFAGDASGRYDGVVDVFGDGSVWALWVPGHTRGSTAFVVRTPSGPVLLTGDACHTRWGWEHDVEPGSFSSDVPRSVVSLGRLRRLAAEHPALDVRLGHQK